MKCNWYHKQMRHGVGRERKVLKSTKWEKVREMLQSTESAKNKTQKYFKCGKYKIMNSWNLSKFH